MYMYSKIDGARQFQECDRFSILWISLKIKKNKQAKFGEHVSNTTEENPMEMEECTLKLHPNKIKDLVRLNS